MMDWIDLALFGVIGACSIGLISLIAMIRNDRRKHRKDWGK